jgi:O-acetyl-ADP-ribose deacetylase (regulator of RNase III)
VKAITYLEGDATRPAGDDYKFIAHCCNDVGAWGAGFVLALSRRWALPERAYTDWADAMAARQQRLPLGKVQFVPVGRQTCVANIIGQRGCGPTDGEPPVRYDALQAGFREIAARVAAFRLGASVHMPRLGCGLAGGVWEKVEYLIDLELCQKDVSVTVYDFQPQLAGGVR